MARAIDQMKESASGVKTAAVAARRKSAELTEKGKVHDPVKRFEELYQENGWTESEFETQIRAVRLTKFFAIGSALVGFSAAMGMLIFGPTLFGLLLAPMGFFVLALGLVQTLKYTLYQEQLRQRKLLTLKEMMSSDGLWRAIFT